MSTTPIGFTNGRYQLPNTPYFNGLRNGMPLDEIALYAQAEQRAEFEGYLLTRGLKVPLSGPYHYSPGGAAIVERAREIGNSDNATARWERAAVISPGTAILGLGSAPRRPNGVLMAGAGGPIMIGKGAYFLMSAGVNTEPITVEPPFTADQRRILERVNGQEHRELLRRFQAENFSAVVASLANNYGFINIEDSAGADLPLIWSMLEAYGVDSVYWSDDRQGTGVIVAAGVLSWAYETGRLKSREKPLEGIRVVIFGAGAGARGVYDELRNHGVRQEDILVTDSGRYKDRSGKAYPLDEGRDDVSDDGIKWEMAKRIPAGTKVREFAQGADLVINLGVMETLTLNLHWTRDLTETLARDPLFLALTNPDPGITPEQLKEVRADARYGSGNQRYKNPFNNFVAFSYNGFGSLVSRARRVNREMTVAAAWGIHEVAKLGPEDHLKSSLRGEQRQFGRDWLVPHPLDPRLIEHEAGAVALAAVMSGASTLFQGVPSMSEEASFRSWLSRRLVTQAELVRHLREEAVLNAPRHFRINYGDRYAPFKIGEVGYDVVPNVDKESFASLAKEMGVVKERWGHLLTEEGDLKIDALTIVLNQLRENSAGETIQAEIARRELKVIVDIVLVHPSLGLALALRRSRVRPENLLARPTLFDRPEVLRVILREVPEAEGAINKLKRWVLENHETAPLEQTENPGLALTSADRERGVNVVEPDRGGYSLESGNGAAVSPKGEQKLLPEDPQSLFEALFRRMDELGLSRYRDRLVLIGDSLTLEEWEAIAEKAQDDNNEDLEIYLEGLLERSSPRMIGATPTGRFNTLGTVRLTPKATGLLMRFAKI